MLEKNISRYIVKDELDGFRLDKCITVLDNEISRMTVQRLIDEGKITVNREECEIFI